MITVVALSYRKRDRCVKVAPSLSQSISAAINFNLAVKVVDLLLEDSIMMILEEFLFEKLSIL